MKSNNATDDFSSVIILAIVALIIEYRRSGRISVLECLIVMLVLVAMALIFRPIS